MIGRTRSVSGHVKTQVIAHDKEVYDIAFSRAAGNRDIFASVGKLFCPKFPHYLLERASTRVLLYSRC